MRIILGALLAITAISSFATAASENAGGLRSQDDRELTYCNCNEVSCSSVNFKPIDGYCYDVCCMGNMGEFEDFIIVTF
jgi:hypothetical protein